MTSTSNDIELLWEPSDPSSTQTERFRRYINGTHQLDLKTYEDLWRWSISRRGDFWSEVWDWHSVIGDKGGSGPYVDESARPADNPRWFDGSSLNWAENQLRHHLDHPNDIAIIQTSEPCPGYDPSPRKVTQKELYELVGQVQRGMKAAGVTRGDRIAFWGGTCLEAVTVLLATSSLGAIFSSAAADFGVDGVAERLEQIRPKLLFVTNAVVYASTPRPLLPLLPKLLSSLSAPPEQTIIIPHLPDSIAPTKTNPSRDHTKTWNEFLVDEGQGVEFVRLGFNEPIWILFSSGTTGRPKAIVHRQGGMLLDSLREHVLAGDMSSQDVYFYYTTPGWMMFQYLVSGLATGATIILYEGSPLKDPSLLWRMIEDFGITIFGTSAKWIQQISKNYPDVGKHHNLTTLKQILSTGSPLAPELFDFVYQRVKRDVLLGSVTGGTDICSVFAGRCTALPVYRSEIQARMLGFALDIPSDANGFPGELICRQAFPNEPLGFWPLPNSGFSEEEVTAAQQRFQESYFKDEQGTWYHGDYVQITSSRSGNGGGLLMLGRSDGVLNPGGIRFGPTDIYTVMDSPAFTEIGVEETLVVGLLVEGGTDEKVILFVKMKGDQKLEDHIVGMIKSVIRKGRSARHVPAEILQVSDIPMTLTGKRVEVPIRKIINGAPASSINPATLLNPACLEEYVILGERLRLAEGM
ncbi:hypothetical protein BCR39DRAFT_555534 [Naematelia encephala]|uniref:AMP-dependent synthetase/ligase domain-containing protein n=1 Tax=Naematelia encephala TaxID=71784 RepID=A0A1Y2BKT3_9TREE|nr:hypothetical protein BCR39DRAFT_555534 [Naematelia encephala]